MKQRGNAVAAFRSAVHALGEADTTSEPLTPQLALPVWEEDLPQEGEEAFIDCADEGVAYTAEINGEGPFRLVLGRSHDQGLWQLETNAEDVRVPVAPVMRLRVLGAAAASGKRQRILAGKYAAPAELAFMGAPGHLVSAGQSGHLFAHVLNIAGRGPTVVHLAVWAPIERT